MKTKQVSARNLAVTRVSVSGRGVYKEGRADVSACDALEASAREVGGRRSLKEEWWQAGLTLIGLILTARLSPDYSTVNTRHKDKNFCVDSNMFAKVMF